MMYALPTFFLNRVRNSHRREHGEEFSCRSREKDGFNTRTIFKKLTELEIVTLNLDIYNL